MATSPGTRNYTIDTGRLVASFCVVVLHVDLGLADQDQLAALRLACRWAVPFFFLVSGYFYQTRFANDPWGALVKNGSRLLNVFVLACLVFLPFGYQRTGQVLKFSYLYEGTHLHLWFLPSMILGLVVLYGLHRLPLSDTGKLVIAGLFILVVLLKDSYANLVPGFSAQLNHHKRILLSVPFLFLGMYYKKREAVLSPYVRWSVGITLVLAGYVLQLAEAHWLEGVKAYPPTAHQFLVGTIFMAVGAFLLVLTVPTGKSRLSVWGESYSLLIYLYHPLLIVLVMTLSQRLGLVESWPVVQAPVVFGLTLLLVRLIHAYLPGIFTILSGSFVSPVEKRLSLGRKQGG